MESPSPTGEQPAPPSTRSQRTPTRRPTRKHRKHRESRRPTARRGMRDERYPKGGRQGTKWHRMEQERLQRMGIRLRSTHYSQPRTTSTSSPSLAASDSDVDRLRTQKRASPVQPNATQLEDLEPRRGTRLVHTKNATTMGLGRVSCGAGKDQGERTSEDLLEVVIQDQRRLRPGEEQVRDCPGQAQTSGAMVASRMIEDGYLPQPGYHQLHDHHRCQENKVGLSTSSQVPVAKINAILPQTQWRAPETWAKVVTDLVLQAGTETDILPRVMDGRVQVMEIVTTLDRPGVTREISSFLTPSARSYQPYHDTFKSLHPDVALSSLRPSLSVNETKLLNSALESVKKDGF